MAHVGLVAYLVEWMRDVGKCLHHLTITIFPFRVESKSTYCRVKTAGKASTGSKDATSLKHLTSRTDPSELYKAASTDFWKRYYFSLLLSV